MDEKPRKIALGGGQTLQQVFEDAALEVHEEVKLKEFSLTGLTRQFKTKVIGASGKQKRSITVLGAAGEEQTVQESKLKIMTDPYSQATRKAFIDCAYTDPNLSPSFERRKDAQFEKGFTLEFELASSRDPVTDAELTPEQSQQKIDEFKKTYLKHLQTLRTWTKDHNLEEILDEFNPHELNQGRCAAFFFPGLLDLDAGQLPQSLEIIPAEDLKEPIIDVGIGRKLVAINTVWKDKRIVRADEIVYGIRKNWMLRKDSRFYGASILEPILIISKALKRIYNYDISEAVIASYIEKIIFQVQSSGNETEQKAELQNLVNDFLTTGKLAFAVNENIMDIKPVPIKTDTNLIKELEQILVNTIIAIIGVPKSMLNRQQGITRDIATIEAILFKKFVKNPDERHISKIWEDQLINPLFAHLAGQRLREIPLRVRIVPVPTDDDELLSNDMSQSKTQEINSDTVVQEDAKTTLGASGLEITSETGGKYLVHPIKTDS